MPDDKKSFWENYPVVLACMGAAGICYAVIVAFGRELFQAVIHG